MTANTSEYNSLYRSLYSTFSEKKFIDGLGCHKFSLSHKVLSHTREELLHKYLKACHNRDRWGDIDKDEIIKYVETMLILERLGGRVVYSSARHYG